MFNQANHPLKNNPPHLLCLLFAFDFLPMVSCIRAPTEKKSTPCFVVLPPMLSPMAAVSSGETSCPDGSSNSGHPNET